MKNKNDTAKIFWQDYETFGDSPQNSGVAQFAGIFTDLDLNIVGKPVNILCKPLPDRLPSPEACMVTHISPLANEEKGMSEVDFFERIKNYSSKPNTCNIGYNSINFDDEVTRNGFYRNFIDPYEREWKNGCSRWDLLDVLRIVDVVKPNTFVVPLNEEGKKSFKLDRLSPANGIEHENAHDALADVYALIYLAKIIKDKEPELFNELFNRRTKKGVQEFLCKNTFDKNNPELNYTPFICSSSFFGGDNNYVEILFPIYATGNDVHCIKISKDINMLFDLTAEEIKELLFKKKADMTEEEQEKFVRPPIHKIQINKCPIMLPLSYVTPEVAKNMGFNGDVCRQNIKRIKDSFIEIQTKIKAITQNNMNLPKPEDVDNQIYSGFFSYNDKAQFAKIKSTESIDLPSFYEKAKFEDNDRIKEMLFRYIGRNYESLLDQNYLDKWNDFCRNRIEEGVYTLTFDDYFNKIEEFKELYKDDQNRLSVLEDMIQFGNNLKAKLYE